MKDYTRDYQIGMDIDWCFLGGNRTIAQFTSAGGILPDLIASNAEDNIILNDFIDNLEPFTEAIINPNLAKYFKLSSDFSLVDYSSYAKKGILIFDKTFVCPGDFDITYHLIARPDEFLKFEMLPDKIKDILLKTQQKIVFDDFEKLDAGYTPWASLFTDYFVPTLHEEPEKSKKSWFNSLFC
jgi:hypothetical protein